MPVEKKTEVKKAKAYFTKASSQVKKQEYLDLIKSPYDLEALFQLYESNIIFYRTVNQIAIDTAGLGWQLVLKEGYSENQQEKGKIERFLNHVNPNMNIKKLLKDLTVDWGVTGNIAFEVVRDAKGEIAELYHVPISTLLVHKSKLKYKQEIADRAVWFKVFGDNASIDKDTGNVVVNTLEVQNLANELMFYKSFYPKSDYWGIPNILPAIGSVIGMIGIRDFNLAFFQNYGAPAHIVELKGDWDEGSDVVVKDFLNTEAKGAGNQHKTLVLTIPAGNEMRMTPLSTDIKDGSFKQYHDILQNEILLAYSMPGYRVGINIEGKLGGTNIKEATEIYKNSVIEPLQSDLEDIINNDIIQKGLNCFSYEFQFENIDTKDEEFDLKMAIEKIKYGILTPNEVIKDRGEGEEYTEGDKHYLMTNLIEAGKRGNENLAMSEYTEKDADGNELNLVGQLVKLQRMLGND